MEREVTPIEFFEDLLPHFESVEKGYRSYIRIVEMQIKDPFITEASLNGSLDLLKLLNDEAEVFRIQKEKIMEQIEREKSGNHDYIPPYIRLTMITYRGN